MRHNLFAVALICAACPPLSASSAQETTTTPSPVAVVVTGWSSPEGQSPEYSKSVYQRSVLGERAEAPDQPCTEWFFGDYPYRSELGRIPFATVHKVAGSEGVWDSYGLYRRAEDGSYASIVDAKVVVSPEDAQKLKVTPAKDMPFGGRARFFTPDPRNGVDTLADYVRIDSANGIHDLLEMSVLAAIRKDALMGYDENAPVRIAPMQAELERYVVAYFADLYGDRVAVKFGYYAATPNLTRTLEDVAAEFARDGYRNLLIARETTDHNLYANTVWDWNHALKGLCRAGFSVGDGGFHMEQVRQVGRTPEYNGMLVKNMRRQMEKIPPGTEVSVIYATHGEPWPGARPADGPMAISFEQVKDVTYENSYLNYLSFKRYALAAYDERFGGDYRINFSKSGGTGSDDARTRNLFGSAHIPEARLGLKDDPLRFLSLRQVIETAVREDGRKDIVIVLSHWYKNSESTGLDIRELNSLPLNTVEEMAQDIFDITWCERYTAPGKFEQQRPGDGKTCPAGFARIQLAEAFDEVAEDFYVGYAGRIRGGVERFGQFPNLQMTLYAKGAVSRRDGGQVAVEDGPLQGARLIVRADPQPNAPDDYTWEKVFRPASHESPNTSPDAIRPINDYAKLADYLEGAKDDFTAVIGTQELAAPGKPMPKHPKAVSQTVFVGPYRTLFDAPAEVTIPYDRAAVTDPSAVRPYILNDASGQFDPVFDVAGAAPPRVDESAGTVSFDVQVLGNFVLVQD